MGEMRTLKRAEYELLLSDNKITKEVLFTNFQADNDVTTLSGWLNLTLTEDNSPIIYPLTLYSQLKYDIVNSIDDNLEGFIAKRISQISEVEYIFCSKKGDYYEIWTIINKLDRGVRERIYDIEYKILGHFKEKYFDFHVICRNDKNINEIIPLKFILFYQRTI